MISFEGGFSPWDRLTERLKTKVGRLEQLALVTADAGKAHGVLVVAVRRALRAAGSSTAATSRSCPTVPFKQGGSLTDHVAVVRSFRATTVCISRDDRPARAPPVRPHGQRPRAGWVHTRRAFACLPRTRTRGADRTGRGRRAICMITTRMMSLRTRSDRHLNPDNNRHWRGLLVGVHKRPGSLTGGAPQARAALCQHTFSQACPCAAAGASPRSCYKLKLPKGGTSDPRDGPRGCVF